jgi:shikimate dehydrogenase
MKAELALSLMLRPSALVSYTVAVPEGFTVADIVARVAKETPISAAAMRSALADPAAIGLPAWANGHVEGFLFPATYQVTPGETATELLKAMITRFEQAATDLDLAKAAGKVGLSQYDVITLASIVQREGLLVSDYRKIAEVFFNRLHNQMRLDSDATLYYVLGPDHGPLTAADLALDSPYNTRKFGGAAPRNGSVPLFCDHRPARAHGVRHDVPPLPGAGRSVASKWGPVSRLRLGAAVLGSPIEHSLSPALHQAAYDAAGLVGWRYRTVECTEAQLHDTLLKLDEEGLAGVSLTMPLKRAVVPFAAATDGIVETVGAANTLLFGADGRWVAANTDVQGFVLSLMRAGLRALRGDVWILGAGATACSALAALAELSVTEVILCARRPEAVTEVREVADRCGIRLHVRPWSDAAAAVTGELVVSCVPAGATDDLVPTLEVASPRGLWFDVVYMPWPTPAASAWDGAGGRSIGGLDLLAEQAAEQVRLMTGVNAPIEVLRAAGELALRLRDR